MLFDWADWGDEELTLPTMRHRSVLCNLMQRQYYCKGLAATTCRRELVVHRAAEMYASPDVD
jgi:hypothetical protein